MKKQIIFLLAVLLIAGCISQTIEEKIETNPDFSEFHKQFPSASLRIELVNNITAPVLYEEVLNKCPDVIGRARYWKVSISDAETNKSLTVWVNDDGNTVCKVTPEGRVEVVLTKSSEFENLTKTKDTGTTTTTYESGGYGGGSGGSSGIANIFGVQRDGPNLVPSIENIKFNTTHLSISYTLKNTGTKDAANARARANISSQTSVDMYPCGIYQNLSAGKSHIETCDFPTVFGYKYGNKYKITIAADPFEKIEETSEDDNKVSNDIDTSSSEGIDLVPTFGEVGTTDSKTPYVLWKVRNRGLNNSISFEVKIDFVRDDGYIADSCSSAVASLLAGESFSGNCSKTIDVTGNYTPRITADHLNQVVESDENNNIQPGGVIFSIVGSATVTTQAGGTTTTTAAQGGTTTTTVQATTTTSPSSSIDLVPVFTSITSQGGGISIEYRIQNAGSSPTTTTFYYNLSIYAPNGFLVGGIGETSHTNFIYPGAPLSGSYNAANLPTGPGDYKVWFIVDSRNNIAESNENNNAISQTVIVSSSPGGGFLIAISDYLSKLFSSIFGK
ncbi:MAG TPA: CARDB domain-containing protein [archaeon]|nr:CARDB domain-containing protein [archaeon]